MNIREQLVNSLNGEEAGIPVRQIFDRVPFELTGKLHDNLPYTIWKLTEHLRITQQDILDYSVGKTYDPLAWPDDYWPASPAPQNKSAWDEAVNAYLNDLDQFIDLILDEQNDLFKPLPHGKPSHTLFRESVLLAEHTAYHTGQIVVLLRLFNAWD